ATAIGVTQRISGGLSGGFTGVSIPAFDFGFNVNDTIPTLPYTFDTPSNNQTLPSNPRFADPVDAIAGANIYSHTDLIIGSGQS
ncbi:hypothetical protein OFB51_25700, partial [Escherichia coli]|nr:hypothetical protein [Escherichia coli]